MIWYTVPMVVFEDIQDVEEWLAPLGYEAFWQAIDPWGIYEGADRAHFDAVLQNSVTDTETMLICLKAEVRIELTARFDLKDRRYEPPDAKYLHRVH